MKNKNYIACVSFDASGVLLVSVLVSKNKALEHKIYTFDSISKLLSDGTIYAELCSMAEDFAGRFGVYLNNETLTDIYNNIKAVARARA